MKEGRKEGRNQERKGGRKEGKKEGRKGRKEGRKERKKEGNGGRKESRKEGRKVLVTICYALICLNLLIQRILPCSITGRRSMEEAVVGLGYFLHTGSIQNDNTGNLQKLKKRN